MTHFSFVFLQPDPDGSISEGYSGKDVLEANIRQLCFARISAKSGSPWLWWGFAEGLYEECSFKDGKFSQNCAEQVQCNSLDLVHIAFI